MPPTESDLNKIGETLDNLTNKLTSMSSLMDKIFNTMSNSANTTMNTVKNAINNTGAVFTKVTNEIGAFNDKMLISIEKLEDAANNFDNYDESAKKAIQTLALLSAQTAILTGALDAGSKAFNGLDKGMSQSSLNAKETIATISKLNGLLGAVEAGAGKFLESAKFGKSFENNLISAINAGSNFNTMIVDDGKMLADKMGGISASLVEKANQTAKLTGISFNEALQQHMNVLAKMPGEYNDKFKDIEFIVKGVHKNIQVSGTESLLLVSRGLGLSLDKVNETWAGMKGAFGSNAWAASERLSIIGKAAKDNAIPIEDLIGVVSNLDKTFEMYGDQALSTVNIINNVSAALQGSNVGFKGQLDIVKTLTDSIKNLSIGTKAFIGLSSGMRSAGGAVGVSLDIERMLQRGETGKIANMMQNTLEQKGGVGRVVSLNETEQNPELQRAFMIQRELIKSQFGISDTGTANRLMEVMSKTKIGGGAAADVGAELNKVLNEGKSTAEKQTNILEDISRNTQHLSALEAIRNYKTLQIADNTPFAALRREDERKINTQRTRNLGRNNIEMSEKAGLEIDETTTKAGVDFMMMLPKGGKALLNAMKNYGDTSDQINKNVRTEEDAINKRILALSKDKSENANKELMALRERKSRLLTEYSEFTNNEQLKNSPFTLAVPPTKERLTVPSSQLEAAEAASLGRGELEIKLNILQDDRLIDVKNVVVSAFKRAFNVGGGTGL